MTKEQAIKISEDEGWKMIDLSEHGYDVSDKFKQYQFFTDSPAGEDFSFFIEVENDTEIPKAIGDYFYCFDVNDHVKMLVEAQGSLSGVPDVVTLVEDAHDIKKMLESLYFAMLGKKHIRVYPTPRFMSLEKLLSTHFKCKKPVKKNSYSVIYLGDGESIRSGLTVAGSSAYKKLTSLLYDLEALVPGTFDVDHIIETLDDMVKGECDGLRDFNLEVTDEQM